MAGRALLAGVKPRPTLMAVSRRTNATKDTSAPADGSWVPRLTRRYTSLVPLRVDRRMAGLSNDERLNDKLGRIDDSIRDYYHWPAIRQSLDGKWGFVIYRCAYGDDIAWERYLRALADAAREDLGRRGRKDLAEFLEWTIFEDDVSLSGASSQTVRERFTGWTASMGMGPWRESYVRKGRRAAHSTSPGMVDGLSLSLIPKCILKNFGKECI